MKRMMIWGLFLFISGCMGFLPAGLRSAIGDKISSIGTTTGTTTGSSTGTTTGSSTGSATGSSLGFSWKEVGTNLFPGYTPTDFDFTLNNANVPYVALAHKKGGIFSYSAAYVLNNNWIMMPTNNLPYPNIQIEAIRIALNADNVTHLLIRESSSQSLSVSSNGIGYWGLIGNTSFCLTNKLNNTLVFLNNNKPMVIASESHSTRDCLFSYTNSGPNWDSCLISFSNCIALSVAQSTNRSVFIAYGEMDYVSKYPLKVKTYNSGSWIDFGTGYTGISNIKATSIAVDGASLPYIACQDTAFNEIVLIKWDPSGSKWTNIAPHLVVNVLYYFTLAISEENIPHIAYVDLVGTDYNLYVKKLVAGTWETLGGTKVGSTATSFFKVQLIFDKNNMPLVLFSDVLKLSNALTLMKFSQN